MIDARFRGTLGRFNLAAELAVPARGITGLFGHSGCGKSSLLRCLAGLLRLPGGYLRVGQETWQEGPRFVPPYERAIGVVFQDARLFTHLSVRDNLRFGLRRAGPGPVAEDAVIAFLGLEGLLSRSPRTLSGGERQRVAIGRALLAQPRLLLMDEPLAALDRESAMAILPRIRALSRDFAVPVVYVSHDVAEIERLADHLLFMQAGRIAAAGTAREILTNLALPFAAAQDAAIALDLPLGSYDADYDLSICEGRGLRLHVPGRVGAVGAVVRLRLCASDVAVSRAYVPGHSVLNQIPARIVEARAQGRAHMILVLEAGSPPFRFLSTITRKSWDGLGLTEGKTVSAQIKAVALGESR